MTTNTTSHGLIKAEKPIGCDLGFGIPLVCLGGTFICRRLADKKATFCSLSLPFSTALRLAALLLSSFASASQLG